MTAIIPEMDPTRPAEVDPTKIIRGRRALRRDEPVRLAGPAPPRRAIRGRARRQAADAAARHLGRGAGAGQGHRAVRDDAPPGVQVFTPYGATEALPVATIGSDTILERDAAPDRPGQGRLRRPAGRRG